MSVAQKLIYCLLTVSLCFNAFFVISIRAYKSQAKDYYQLWSSATAAYSELEQNQQKEIKTLSAQLFNTKTELQSVKAWEPNLPSNTLLAAITDGYLLSYTSVLAESQIDMDTAISYIQHYCQHYDLQSQCFKSWCGYIARHMKTRAVKLDKMNFWPEGKPLLAEVEKARSSCVAAAKEIVALCESGRAGMAFPTDANMYLATESRDAVSRLQFDTEDAIIEYIRIKENLFDNQPKHQ